MEADLTVISLRPGGGAGTRGSRFSLGLSSSSSSVSLPLRSHGGFETGDLRFEGHERVKYTRDQLLQLREVTVIPENILKIKKETVEDFIGEDPNWGHGDSNLMIISDASRFHWRQWVHCLNPKVVTPSQTIMIGGTDLLSCLLLERRDLWKVFEIIENSLAALTQVLRRKIPIRTS